MGFSLSTSWNAFRYTDGEAMVFEIEALGFNQIELSFNLTPAMVKDVEKLVKTNRIKVSSVHNFCPIPSAIARELALPDCYSLASLYEPEREKAVAATKKTIETSVSLNAKAVVLHCGRVEIFDRTMQLIKLYADGQKDSPEFNNLKEEAIRERESSVLPFFENVLISLRELNDYAKKSGIALGIETRYYYREIPSFEEIGIILKKFAGANIFYWHDTGHAEVMENLGINRHRDYLEAYAKDMLGIHLHDVDGCDDHRSPLKGKIDFTKLKPYLVPETIKVIEAHHPATAEELRESKKFLEKTLNGKT